MSETRPRPKDGTSPSTHRPERPGTEGSKHGGADANVSVAIRSLMLLAGEGGSVALLVCGLTGADWLPAFVARNHLPGAIRSRIVVAIAVGALTPCVIAMAAFLRAWRRGVLHVHLDRTRKVATALAVLLPLWAVPQVMSWQAWVGRDITFLMVAGALALSIERTLLVSLRALSETHISSALKRRAALHFSGTRHQLHRWGPSAIVVVAMVGYISYMGRYTALQHQARLTTGFDLGGYGAFFWNTIHGRPFYCPIFHPRTTLYLMIHAEPAVYLLAPFYALRPVASTLLLLQSALLGLSAIPLYLFACLRLRRRWPASVLAVAFLLFPGVHLPNFYDFHFLTVSTFFILWAAYFYQAGRHIPFWIAVTSALMCREDVAIGGVGVGLAILLAGTRPRTGAALTTLSVAYLTVTKFVVMPMFGDASFVHHYLRLVAPGEAGFSGILRTLISNPIFALSSMLVPEKLPMALHVLVPVAFLPLRKLRHLALLAGGILVVFLSTDAPPVIDIRYQYVAHFTPYAFVAATLALEDIGVERGSIARVGAVAALAGGTLFATSQFGALNQAAFVGGHGKVVFSTTEEQRGTLQNLLEIAKTIPSNATLAATERDCPHVAEREHLFTLKYADQSTDVQYMLYGYDNLDYGDARRTVTDALVRGTHGFHSERPGFVVLRRNAPTDRNNELLAKLR